MTYTIDDLGYGRTLTKQGLFDDISVGLAESIQGTLPSYFSDSVPPENIRSGEMAGNLNIVEGYLQSSNFTSGVTGWKFDATGNLEANSGTFRGTLYATVGSIGDWIIDSDGIYYNGSGTPSIRTSEAVESGDNGVILDKDGIRVYSSSLGQVIDLPSDGSAPSFASGTIQYTTFEVDTQAVIRTSSTVGDGTSDSAGVLINNSGLYACEANQELGNANVRISKTGDAYFKGTVESSTIQSSTITGAEINGSIITGGLIRTAETGQRIEMDSEGIELRNAESGSTYSDATRLYNDSSYPYGNGVLGYINNSTKAVPFYINAEQTVADAHFYNRTADPTGAAEVGDLCVVNGRLKICVVAGTPGGWEVVGAQEAVSSPSASVSPSVSPSVSLSRSPSVSLSVSPSTSPSVSTSTSPSVSESLSPSISPSVSVSVSPSVSESLSPSVSDEPHTSYSPSASPSISTSLSPSMSVSISQSVSPSISISRSPSVSISRSPSKSPSVSPSVSPSAGTYIVDSYSESNHDATINGYNYVGQTFTGDGGTLDKVKFYLKKYGSPALNIYAKIYAMTGTFGSSGKPTGSALATSDAVSATTLTTSLALKTFTFTGVNKITLEDGVYYCVVYEYPSTEKPSNYLISGSDHSSPTHAGNFCYSLTSGSSWSSFSDYDSIFYVYKD